jgi:hypothetical protein
MKITKSRLKQIIKEELGDALEEGDDWEEYHHGVQAALTGDKVVPGGMEGGLDVEQLIEQGRSFFDQVIQFSKASEEDPQALEKLNQIEAALSRYVEEKSDSYVKFRIVG